MILGIRKDGMVICDKKRKELMFLPYNQIASWGVNNNVFVVVVQKTEYELKKIYFDSFNVRTNKFRQKCFNSYFQFIQVY